MQTALAKKSQNEEVAVVQESEEKYISSKAFFDLLRKEVNSHYESL